MGLIAQGSDAVMEPVQALLEVAGYPDDDICSNSFLFWHKLASQVCTILPVGCSSIPISFRIEGAG